MQDVTDSTQIVRKIPSPFLDDVFVGKRTPLPGTTKIHQEAMTQCIGLLENLISETDRPRHWGATGRTILISAPRAGYGKSHLIGRLRTTTESLIAAIELPFDPSRSISWKMVMASLLRQYSETRCPQNSGCSLLEETARFFLANLVRAALSGKEPSERGCPEDDDSLRLEFRDLFDRHSKSRMLTWVSRRCAELGEAASGPMRERWRIGHSELTFWTGLFLDFTQGREDALKPLRGLSNGEARARVLQLMCIASECRPIAVVVDHLDGFYGSDTAGMAIAEILTSIRTEVTKTLTLFCINDDLWDSIFEKKIPSAWLDRLTGERSRLGPVTAGSARDLVAARLAEIRVTRQVAEEFISRLSEENHWDDVKTVLYPRDIIRQARAAWEKDGGRYYKPHSDASAPAHQFGSPSVNPSPPNRVRPPSRTFSKPGGPKRDEPAVQAKQDLQQSPLQQSSPATDSSQKITGMRSQSGGAAGLPGESSDPGIESIIDDIRGTGHSVMSDGPASQSPPILLEESFQAWDLSLRPARKKSPRESDGFQSSPVESTKPIMRDLPKPKLSPEESAPPTAGVSPEQSLRDREAALTHSSKTLQLDLPRIEKLIQTVGRHHPALNQGEEHFLSSRSVCLRWRVHDRSILIGFDSPRNVYFWNSLLQQVVEAEEASKITSFSHRSQPFDPTVFTSFGFSRDLVDRHIDIVEMNDKELAMVYAAETLIEDAIRGGSEARAIEVVARRLDPLWRRISQPLAVPG